MLFLPHPHIHTTLQRPSCGTLLVSFFFSADSFFASSLGGGGEEIEAEAGTHKHEAKQGRGGGKEKGPKQSLDAQLR